MNAVSDTFKCRLSYETSLYYVRAKGWVDGWVDGIAKYVLTIPYRGRPGDGFGSSLCKNKEKGLK